MFFLSAGAVCLGTLAHTFFTEPLLCTYLPTESGKSTCLSLYLYAEIGILACGRPASSSFHRMLGDKPGASITSRGTVVEDTSEI